MALQIPEIHHSAFRHLNSLSGEQVDAAVRVIAAAGPVFSITQLAERMSSAASLERGNVDEILHVLVSLYGALDLSGDSLDDFVNEAVSEAERSIRDESSAQADWSPLRRHLLKLLPLDSSLGVTAKALGVMVDHEHVFRSARALSDMRPVFGSDVSAKPAAMTIIHMLRIDYSDRDRWRSISFALDANDLRVLKETIERALAKEDSLRSLSKELDVPCLDVRDLKD